MRLIKNEIKWQNKKKLQREKSKNKYLLKASGVKAVRTVMKKIIKLITMGLNRVPLKAVHNETK